ncbi:unnamed protein product [Cuscuta campestris]|uniref:Retrotransposon gag domain-containing protein n=1 Tax=Cuscuta campestris TaxID=132261 RepID=A0A484LPH6_9ASTE|nr:unnamed protein product [Cuscuta campestris]
MGKIAATATIPVVEVRRAPPLMAKPHLPDSDSCEIKSFLTGATTSTGKDDADWLQLDALIQGWILSTVNDEVSDLIISSTTSAADLWKAIHNLFHDNKAARAMQLEQRFYSTVKGASTIATYCQTLRNIADWLDDVDAPVTENQLVLQTLRGLPEDLGSQASFLQFQKPPLTFMETRSALLLLEGQRRPQTASGDEGTALATLGHGGHAGSGSRGAVVRLQAAGSRAAVAADSTMADSFRADNLRATADAGTAMVDAVDDRTAVAVEPLTPTALAHHLDTMTLREPSWLMDTGATHHIASDPEFDSHGFSVKDSRTGTVIQRCNNEDPLYPLRTHDSTAQAHVASVSAQTSATDHKSLSFNHPNLISRKLYFISTCATPQLTIYGLYLRL